ncbi:MAG: hypothetical protein KDI13_04260 [Alphaproteobacteria bacterium]|nr:hypothetical protein [Alphaproteobacteria bacterium]
MGGYGPVDQYIEQFYRSNQGRYSRGDIRDATFLAVTMGEYEDLKRADDAFWRTHKKDDEHRPLSPLEQREADVKASDAEYLAKHSDKDSYYILEQKFALMANGTNMENGRDYVRYMPGLDDYVPPLLTEYPRGNALHDHGIIGNHGHGALDEDVDYSIETLALNLGWTPEQYLDALHIEVNEEEDSPLSDRQAYIEGIKTKLEEYWNNPYLRSSEMDDRLPQDMSELLTSEQVWQEERAADRISRDVPSPLAVAQSRLDSVRPNLEGGIVPKQSAELVGGGDPNQSVVKAFKLQ